MISAVLYNSCTGSCERYARELGQALHLPVYEAKKCPVPKGREVIFVSWVFADRLVGLSSVTKHMSLAGVVRVGMAPAGPGTENACRGKNSLPADTPIFCLQGRFDLGGLPLPLRLIMKVKIKDIARRLSAKEELTPGEQATLRMALDGKGEPATWDGIQDVIAYYRH